MLCRRCLMLALLAAATLAAHAADQVYYRAADGTWRPLAAHRDGARGTVTFTLDPTQLRGGATMVLLEPPRGILLDDEQPPLLTGLKVDGRPLKDSPVVDLDWLEQAPRTLLLAFTDRANPLDAASLDVRLNGRQLPAGQARLEYTDPAHHSARLLLPLAALLAGRSELLTTVEVRLADLSPQRNTIVRQISYRCLGPVSASPALFADTCCSGYENLGVLLDGKVMTPGETTFGCTWASVEEPGDHWLVLAWPQDQPRTLRGVQISWANYQATFWTARKLLVQTWQSGRWVTQKTAEDLPATAASTVEFAPVKTTRLRLLQPDGKGHASRPNIMWLTEVKVLADE